MLYLKLFQTEQERLACTDTYGYVSYTVETDKVHMHKDFSKTYLTFVAKSNGIFKFIGTTSGSTSNTISYSTDNGNTWSTPAQETSVEVNSGDNVFWKGEMVPYNYLGIGSFGASTSTFDVQGNIMSLLYGDNFVNQTDLSGKTCAFYNLFKSSKIINAENIIMTATTLDNLCYSGMFSDCTLLITSPQLPATALAEGCYNNMFNGCTSLIQVPQLPATTLATGCYSYMFNRCTHLTDAPQLPATILANFCYSYMFGECSSLTAAPELPAITLVNNCYINMFTNCISLTQAPELPAITLAESCYAYMFAGCTSLTTAPELPAIMLVTNCYGYMFIGCTNLNYIKAMFTTTPSITYTSYWVEEVAASGTFVKNSVATWNVTNVNGIPTGWTVETASE